MARYFMHLAYRGLPFHGWQRQPSDISIQQVLEEAISKILRQETALTGAGRTDTGVNARRMIAHFDTDNPLPLDPKFINALNSLCGPDIAVYSVAPVHPEAHARFDATARTYRYFAAEQKSPFFHQLSWKAPARLDYEAMNHAAELLLHTSDFTSFSKLHTDVKTNICHVTEARWTPIQGGGMQFIITADRFLRNMVRAVVGTLVEVGRGKISIPQFQAIIDARDRCAAGTSMPPQALYLWDVTYPYITIDPATGLILPNT